MTVGAASAFQAAPQRPDLGAIKNRFNILTPDYKKFRPKALASVAGLGPTEFAREFRTSRPSAYREEVLLKPEQKQIIINIVMATDMAYELLGNNLEEARKWFLAPNSLFFGDSPFEICLRGEGKQIVEWLNERSGKQSGVAY